MLDLPVVWAEDTLAAPARGGDLDRREHAGHRAARARHGDPRRGRRCRRPDRARDGARRLDAGVGARRRAAAPTCETCTTEWVERGYQEYQKNVVPYVFPTAGMLDGLPVRVPYATHGRAGLYCYDTMTLIGAGTWQAARAAVDASLTAADLVAGGERVAYAICRPPGHHATRDAFGGSCYLNNAGVAVEALRAAGVDRVAVIDIDAHHGNGTQALFYDRDDVFYTSTHVDPGAGWFPHYAGYADETGRGAGVGTNLNIPLAPGHRRRRLAGRGRLDVRRRGVVRRRGGRGVARCGRGGRRSGVAAGGHVRRLPRDRRR